MHLREVYEQKLHTSGIVWAMLQNKQKPGYCTEHYNVNAEAAMNGKRHGKMGGLAKTGTTEC